MLENNRENAQITIDHFSEIVDARINLYHFFSSFYHKPLTKGSLKALLTNIVDTSFTDIFSLSCLKKIQQLVQNCENDYDIIFQEFHNLFLVPGAQYVTPYESCFREKRLKKGKPAKGLLMGKSTREVIQFYRENELKTSEESKDLPDHIVLELNFMFTLWETGNHSEASQILQKEKRFLKEHIIHWVPALCEEICEKTKVPFYQGIAQMTREFIEMEESTFSSLAV